MPKTFILVLAFLIIGCSSEEKSKNKIDAPNFSQLEYQEASSILISSFMTDLKSELMKGVKDGGFGNAINVCQLQAPAITEKFLNQNYSIKRVTDRPRDPLNNADEHELQILAQFADSLSKLDFFDEWKDPENKKDYYFYKPIFMGKLCLKCHGSIKAIDDKANIALKEKYPEDKAIDYMAGDLRGMFVVNIKDSAGIADIQSLNQDSL